jgi:hypothetical protein
MDVALTCEEGSALEGALEFAASEHSFRFTAASPVDLSERVDGGGLTSLAIGTLQVEVSVATGLLLFVWGLHPRASWRDRAMAIPHAAPGVVRVSQRETLRSGVSLEIAGVGAWSTSFDAETSWVRVGRSEEPDDVQVLIATDTAMGLKGRWLNSIWLRPEFE